MTETTQNKTIWQVLQGNSRTVRFLLLGAFVNQLGYFIQAYIIVFMLARGFGALEAGWGLAIFSASSVLGTLAAAPVSARIGDRNTIVLSSILMAIFVALIPTAVVPDRPAVVWVGAISIAGVFAQMYRPAAAHILSHHFPADYQVISFSMLRIALNLGGALGPVIATALAQIDWGLVFWFNAAATLAFAVIALIMIPDERPATDTTKMTGQATGIEPSGWGALLADRRFVAFLAAMFLSSIVFTQFYATVPLVIEQQGKPLSIYSTLLTVYAIVLITFELKISSIVRQYPVWIPATIGTTILCLGVASFGLTLTSDFGLVLSAVILVGGLMVSGPTMFAYPARFPLRVRSTYIAANQAVFSAGLAVGPIIGVAIFNSYGQWVWAFCFVLALVSGALCVAGMRPPAARSSTTVRGGAPIAPTAE